MATCTTPHKNSRYDLEDRLRGGVVVDVTTTVADAFRFPVNISMDVYKYLAVGYLSVFRVNKENITT